MTEEERLIGLNMQLVAACRAALPVVKWASSEQSPPGAYGAEERKLLNAIAEAEVTYITASSTTCGPGQLVAIIPEAGTWSTPRERLRLALLT